MKTSIVLDDDVVEIIDRKIAPALSLNRSAFIRMVLKRELIRMGYMDMPLPSTEAIQQNPEGEKESDLT